MFISRINHCANAQYNYQKIKKSNVTFQAHPDFVALEKCYDIKASSYFRRGPFWGAPSDEFQDIINVFRKIFVPVTSKKEMLIVGIGESQESFSYLAVIKSLVKDKNLSDVLDLNIVDMQSKPTKKKLFKNSYYEYSDTPRYAANSFVEDIQDNIRYGWARGYYRVKDDIFEFLNATYENKNNSKWEQRIQDVSKDYPDEKFDIISMNNTLGYIKDKETRNYVVQEIYRALKPNGVFITDPHCGQIQQANLSDKFPEIKEGIFFKRVNVMG